MPIANGLAASAASVMATAFTFPIDSYRVNNSIPLQKFNLKSAYNGFPITAINLTFCRYIAFTIKEEGEKYNKNNKTPIHPKLLSALSSGLTGCKAIIMYPGDIIKINQQTSTKTKTTIMKEALSYPLNYHAKIIATMWSKTTIGYFTWFETQSFATEFNKKHGSLGTFVSGAASSAICSITITPFEIIKINMQTGKCISPSHFIKRHGFSKLMPQKQPPH